MSKVDWSKAPEGAEFYAYGCFRKDGEVWNGCLWLYGISRAEASASSDYQPRPTPQEKPMKYEYGVEYPTNGVKPDLPDDVLVEVQSGKFNFGELPEFPAHRVKWENSTAFRIVDQRYKPATATVAPTTAAEYLSACAQVQLERGKQYDASGTGERSFDAAAEAFNCITGKHLRGSDVCLILELVKKVRQYSDPARLHADSVLDAVSYASLWAEELTKELGK